MLDDRQFDISSMEELMSKLEHIEESELYSDIRQNVCAELKRIKRNVSAVLSFVDHSRLPNDPELILRATEIRRDCIAINAMISRILLLYMVRMGQQRCREATERVLGKYRGMAEATCQMCQLIAPSFAPSLARAL
jgi:hypothetical protein